GRVVKALGGRRREQLAYRDGVQHVSSRITDEGRLVARAAAGYDANLSRNRGIAGGDHARIVRDADDVSMRFDEALDRVFDNFIRVVDEPLHGDCLTSHIAIARSDSCRARDAIFFDCWPPRTSA